MSDRMVRWGGIAGIVFVVLILVTVFATGSPPMADDPADKLRTFFVDHRTALLVSNVIGMVAIPFALWFAVVLRELFRGEREASAFGTLSLAGLLVAAPMAMVGSGMEGALVYVDGVADKIGDDTIRIVFELQTFAFAATSAGIIAFTLGAALAIRRSGTLPSYVMWVGYLAVLGNLVALISVLGPGASALGLFGVLTFALFILIGGLAMVTGKATPAAT